MAQLVKNLPATQETWTEFYRRPNGFDPWVGKEGKGYPLQYFGLENSMDCLVHGVAKSRTRLSDFHLHFLYYLSHQGSPQWNVIQC